jgi:hypothetical protein
MHFAKKEKKEQTRIPFFENNENPKNPAGQVRIGIFIIKQNGFVKRKKKKTPTSIQLTRIVLDTKE